MVPTLGSGVRSVITNNDTQALDSFGYSLGASVPHPAPPPPAPTGPPANDNFAAATTLQGAAGTITGDSTGATREAGEPVHPASPGGRSVWFNWTAPASGSATFDTEGSGFDTILAVYTGGSLGALTRIAANDDIQQGTFTNSRLTFTATAGTTYRIAVDGFINDASVGAEFGIIQLNWSASAPPPLAATIQFASAYATAQGDPLETRDYTFARATLRFAPNEASKTFSVLITDDSFAELNELFNVQLVSAVGTTISNANGVVSVQIIDNDAQNGPNPLDNSTSYVRLHYHDFLNREPDTSGLNFWTGEIEGCGPDSQCREVKRINVSGAFFLSIEFQNTGYLVYRIYKAAYGNMSGAPVPVRLQEFLPDTLEIGQGVQVGVGNWEQQLEANKQSFFGEFVTRGRFKTALPPELSPAQFVDALNANAGGVLSAAERDALVAQLAASNTAQTRAAVLRRVAENQTLNGNEFNRAFVLMQYFGFLRRH